MDVRTALAAALAARLRSELPSNPVAAELLRPPERQAEAIRFVPLNPQR